MRLIILLLLLANVTFAQTDAGEDQTIYLASGHNYINLNGSGIGPFTWSEISTDITSGGTITSVNSTSTTITGLAKQGTFYFQLNGNGVRDTMVLRVNHATAPSGGTLIRSLPLSEPGFIAVANNRDDTLTWWQPINAPQFNSYTNSQGNIYFQRARPNGMYIDTMRAKFYSTVEDGYAGETNTTYGKYARAELHYGTNVGLDSNTTYVYEWKGYYPTPVKDAMLEVTNDIYSSFLSHMQWHGVDNFSPPFAFRTQWANIQFIEYGGQGNGANTVTDIMTTEEALNSHTIRVTIREGKGYTGQDAFIKVELDGVTKYHRTTGQVGQTFQQDYVKFASVYDARSVLTDPENTTRNKKFSLITEAFNVYTVNTPPEPDPGPDQFIILPFSQKIDNQ